MFNSKTLKEISIQHQLFLTKADCIIILRKNSFQNL